MFRLPNGTGEAAWKWAVRLGGLAIMLSQLASPSPTDKPFLYAAAVTMMGLTFTIPADLRRQRKRSDEDDAS